MKNPLFVSVNEACKALSLGRSSFYEAVSRGEIILKKHGRRSLVPYSEITKWAERLPVAVGSKSEAA